MDPNEQLNAIERIIDRFKPMGPHDLEDLCSLVYLINDLNIYICQGGMLPEKWQEGLLKQVLPGTKSLNDIIQGIRK